MKKFCVHIPKHLIYHLQNHLTVQPLNDGYVIVTPFLHFDMSFIELYVEPSHTGYILSDGGETLHMLFVSGLTVEKQPDLMRFAQQIASNHDVIFKDSAIVANVTDENVGEVMVRLIHAIQAIGFFIYFRTEQNQAPFGPVAECIEAQAPATSW